MSDLKNIANEMNRLVGDLVVFTGERMKLSPEDKVALDGICDKLDAVQKRLDSAAMHENALKG